MTKPSRRLLGIDPGTNILGYAIVEIRKKEPQLVEMGVVRMSHLENHHQKLCKIFERLQELIRLHKPNAMAVEAPFFGKNVQSMLKLGRAQGVAIAAGITMGLDITEFSPKKIKKSITGNGNASKEQVAAMLSSILKQPLDAQTFDATDALAAAVCLHFQSNSKLAGQKRYSNWASYLSDNPDKLA
ncbi:MAG: crossover junction endodeoxyribonuclease RuvC [Bacteroidota bacterium]